MGIVYKARQISLNRLVALKMVLAGAGASSSMLARFRNEAEAAARLQHVNIVQIFAIGEHEGRPFLTLELVEGETLAHRLDGTPQRPRAAAALVEILARAIEVAHENGIIHRDLKPSNILLKSTSSSPVPLSPSRQGASRTFWKAMSGGASPVPLSPGDTTRAPGFEVVEYGVPKIADFGLAKLLDDSARLTHTGDLLGTPRYMAPEQALFAWNDSQDERGTGRASDIYSLGAILYEMITGQPPFRGDTAMKTLLQVLHKDPVSPSELQPKVPYDLATICLKCLEKEASKRYASALALAEDLRRFRHGEPILAQRIGPVGVIWRRCRRYPGMALLIGALVISFISGFVTTTVSWIQSEKHRRMAELNADRAESSLYFSRIAQAQLEWRLNNPGAVEDLLGKCIPRPGEPDRRGWEWHCLNNFLRAELLTMNVKAGSRDTDDMLVSDARFSQDGRRLLVAGGSLFAPPRPFGELSVWDFSGWDRGETPSRVRYLREDRGYISVMTASRDGRIIAFGGDQGLIKIWDTGAETKPVGISGHNATISSLSLSRDGSRVAAADQAGCVTVTDTVSRTVKLRLRGTCVRLVGDGRQLIVGDASPSMQSQELEVRDATDGHLLRSLSFKGTSFLSAPFEVSADERELVVWRGSEARIVDLESGQIGPTLPGHSGDITQAVFSPDRMHVATAGADRTVRLWDPRTGTEELVFRGHRERVNTVVFHPNGRYLASGDQQRGDVKIWDLTRHPEFLTIRGLPTVVRNSKSPVFQKVAFALGFTPNSRRLIEIRRDGTLANHDAHGVPGMEPLLSIPMSDRMPVPATVADFRSDGRQLAGIDDADERRVIIWDVPTGGRIRSLQGSLPIFHLGWSSDGKRIVTAGLDWKLSGRRREVIVWEASTGEPVAQFQPGGHYAPDQAGVYGVAALSPDGKLVAFDVLSEPKKTFISICEVSSRRQVTRLVTPDDSTCSLEFSASGRLLALGTADGRLSIHDVKSGRALHGQPLQSLSGLVGTVTFSPDERVLASVSRDQLEVWHVETGQAVLALRGAPPRRGDNAFDPRAAWSPDGKLLAALNHNYKITVWDGSDDQSSGIRRANAEYRAFAWHLAHAQAAVFDADLRTAAEFHVRALADLEPPSEELSFERAILYAWLGRWQQAATDLARIGPSRIYVPWALEQALVLLQVNDVAAYGRICAGLREQHGKTVNHATGEILVRVFQLMPKALVDPQEMIRWSQLSESVHTRSLLLGGTYYRMGRHQDAVQQLQRALANQPTFPVACAFLAMSYAQLGQVGLAKQEISRLDRWLADQQSSTTARSMTVIRQVNDWQTWLEVRILLREANDVIRAAELAKPRR